MANLDISFRIGGEAGQGVESSGAGFAKALTRAGLHLFALPDYYSRIRGGHNFFTLRVSDRPLVASKESVEVLLALNAECLERHAQALSPDAVIIIDEKVAFDRSLLDGRAVHLLQAPLVAIAKEHGSAVMVNTALLAYAAGVVGFDVRFITEVIAETFGIKGASVAESNRLVAEAAYALARERHSGLLAWSLPTLNAPQRLTIDGNHAFALGALMAGCKFVAGYPMTPATSVLEYAASHADDWGLVVKHAEDEIAAINMVVGAAHAGVRAMAATSGGGFDLMVEGLSMAGMAEVPTVVYLCQRPGPATGLATRTAQADLLMALYSSHGEYPKVLLAPHTPQEAFTCGVRAHNLAEKYQCVVIVLSDHYNATALWSIDAQQFDLAGVSIERGKLLQDSELDGLDDYLRYALTADGVSPRALPGHPHSLQLASSNEHTEDGQISEDAAVSARMLDKRLSKLVAASAEIRPPLQAGPPEAKITFVSWGSSYGPVYEAMQHLNTDGAVANMVHWVDLWPFPVEFSRQALAQAQRIVAVEGNGTAQFAQLLYAQTGIQVDDRILRYDGRGFTPAYIVKRLGEV
jgi:2-oxoglutarate ferredoxin oxidoreductase subunit alpha